MPRILTLFFVLSLLTLYSCNSNEDIVAELNKRILQSNLIIQDDIERTLKLFEQKVVDDPEKMMPYYKKAATIRNICKNFTGKVNQLMTEEDKSIDNKTKTELLTSYFGIIDTLTTFIFEDDRNKFHFCRDSSTVKNISFDKYTISRLQNDILINEFNTLEYLMARISGTSCYFGPRFITWIKRDSLNSVSGDMLKFWVADYYCNFDLGRYIYIDTIRRNGKLIEKNPKIEYQPDPFATLKLENFESGEYEIKGHITTLERETKIDYPFEHKFNKK